MPFIPDADNAAITEPALVPAQQVDLQVARLERLDHADMREPARRAAAEREADANWPLRSCSRRRCRRGGGVTAVVDRAAAGRGAGGEHGRRAAESENARRDNGAATRRATISRSSPASATSDPAWSVEASARRPLVAWSIRQ